jgi:hypothetical protein
MRLLFPLSSIINRPPPIIQIHIYPLRQRDTTTSNCTSRPQPHEFQISSKAQKQRKRHRNNVIHKQIRPPANRLQSQAAQNCIRQCRGRIAELEHRKERQHGGHDGNDFWVCAECFGQDVATRGEESKVDYADDEEGQHVCTCSGSRGRKGASANEVAQACTDCDADAEGHVVNGNCEAHDDALRRKVRSTEVAGTKGQDIKGLNV